MLKKVTAKKKIKEKCLEANFMIKQNGYLDMRANLDFDPAPSFLRRWYLKKGAQGLVCGRFYNLSKNRSSGGTNSESPFRFRV